MDSRGLYIYDDGFRLILRFGKVLSPDIAMNLLGADLAADLSKVWYNFARKNRFSIGIVQERGREIEIIRRFIRSCNLSKQFHSLISEILLLTSHVQISYSDLSLSLFMWCSINTSVRLLQLNNFS